MKYTILLILLICTPVFAIDSHTPDKHKSMLYPTIQCSSGSGVVIKAWNEEVPLHDGTTKTKNFAYVLTAYHVYQRYQERSRTKKILPCKWFRYDKLGRPVKQITTIGHLEISDVELDMAILKIQTGKELHPVVESSFDNEIALFDKVYSVGFPLGWLRIGQGNVTRLPKKQIYIEHDTHLFYGSSGGPLFNKDYKLVGINTQTITWRGIPLTYIGRAVPLYEIGAFLGEERVKEYFGVEI